MKKISHFIFYLCYGVILYVPFHALFSTFLIDVIGGKLPIKGLKDLFILLTLIPLMIGVYVNRRKIKIEHRTLWFMILAFAELAIFYALFIEAPNIQKVAGLIIQLRHLGFFVICYLGALILEKKFSTSSRLVKIVILCSVFVVFFGALQVLILPNDFLKIFGYGESTIMPYQTIDNNESFVRILSTLRGPNPLGAYLAMVAPLAATYIISIKKRKNWFWALYAIAFIITLYGSHSRSAWIGFVIGTLAYLYLSSANKKIIGWVLGGLLIVGSGLFFARNTIFIQTTLFHRDPAEASEINSDNQRLDSISSAVRLINEKPLGHGIGSSGPASNYGSKPYIIENHYLDLAYQLGWLGLILSLGITSYVGYIIIKLKTKLAYAHVAGLLAISSIAMFWPVWSDETIALIWWGLAGFIISRSNSASLMIGKKLNEKH